MTNADYIVRGLTANGDERFYTGRAGDGWISADRVAAFRYQSKDAAASRAKTFNRMADIHGVRFMAALADVVYCVECGAETELDCICDDLNFADHSCECGAHNDI